MQQAGFYDAFTLTLGGRTRRAEFHARLRGPGATVHLNAAQMLGGDQVGDVTTVVMHDAPLCASRQTVKNVLTGHARGVFQGRIEVERVAQKTDGYQMSQALLLSPDAEIDCKPELQIYADDVKCSHGATIGELNTDQLFYLRARGIPEAEARSMLVRAFLDDALQAVTHEAGAPCWSRRSRAGGSVRRERHTAHCMGARHMNMMPPHRPSTWSASAPSSRSCSSACTASRWCSWTAPPPP